MKSFIRILSWLFIIVGAAFFLNDKLKLHISFLEIKTYTMLYVYIGAIVLGAIGLYFTRNN